MDRLLIEILGYFASITVAISLSMSNLLWLRILNLIGAFAFTIYGLINQVYPVAAVNGYITIIDIYYLFQMRKTEDFFYVMEVESNNTYLKKFIDFYIEDINKFFPDFTYEKAMQNNSVILLRNMQPAGLFIYKKVSDNKAGIILDYVINAFRDLKNAQFLFSKHNKFFKQHNITELVITTDNQAHINYLKKLKFTPISENTYHKEIK
jgi:hypothetical protein